MNWNRLLFFSVILFGLPMLAHAECKEHIALLSAKEVAAEIGKTEMWVLQNFKVNLWQKPTSQGKGRVVGKLLPGSHAVILERGPQDYKVRSPLDPDFPDTLYVSMHWIRR